MTDPASSRVGLVRRHGGPVSHAALDPSRKIFQTDGIDGLVVYLVAGRCAVALGDPVCAAADRPALADAFAAHCAGRGWSVLYVAAGAAMQAHARARGYASVEFAEQLTANPADDPETGPEARHLRQHLNNLRRAGVAAREYLGAAAPDDGLEARAQAALAEWLKKRQGPQMCLGRPRLFGDREGRRWFVAEQEGRVLGLLSLLRAGGTGGWLMNFVFAAPAAPPHTNDLLVATALRALREEGVETACLGLGPLAALGAIEGLGGAAEFFARHLYRLAVRYLHLHGRTVFWQKFRLARRDPLYLLFQPPRLGWREAYALLKAFHMPAAG